MAHSPTGMVYLAERAVPDARCTVQQGLGFAPNVFRAQGLRLNAIPAAGRTVGAVLLTGRYSTASGDLVEVAGTVWT